MAVVSMAAAVSAAPEGVLHRKIGFHLAKSSHAAVAVGGGGFRMETLNPDAAAAAARRPEKGEAGGFDPELSVARIYLGKIGAGLQNLGNTCYLNSVLQCLTYTEPFAAYLQSGRHKSSCRTAGFCALCALQNHVKTALQSTGKIVTPSQFVKNLRCISRSFRNSRQEDAHELMVNLLESMHKCCLPSGVPSESPSAYEKSLVHRIFGGRLRSQVKCTRCSHSSNKFEPFLDLSLDIAKATTLVRALQNFTEEELLDGGEKQYQCERCRQKVVAKKKFTIDKAPNVLTIHLKRFSPFNPREKIDKKVDFQPALDLKPFISDSKGTDCKYSLYGVLVHAGWNTQSGHYYCFVRTSSGLWHNLDDNQVRQVREADVLKQKAYMLFYVRDRVGNTMVRKDSSTANMPGKKMIPEKISCLNAVIQSGVIEAKLNGPSSPFVDKKLQSLSNGHSGIISKTSADHCSKNDGKTEAAAASQINGLSSAQKAFVPRSDGATLSTKSMQIALSSLKEASSSGQPASLINARSNQTMAEMSLQEPKTDGAFTKLENSTSVASPMVSSPARLSEADKQTSQSQTTRFYKTTSNVNNMDTGVTAQTFPTKDDVVSNGVMTSSGGSTSSEKLKDLIESLEQDDKIVKELTVDKNNIIPGLEQLNFGEVICSEVPMKVVAARSCNGSIAKRVVMKSKKLVRYPVVNLWLGPRQLLLGSLKQEKRRKHSRTKRQSKVCKGMANTDCSGNKTNEQQTSTSATVPSENVECAPRGWKRAYASPSSENDARTFKNRQQVIGAGAGDLNLDKRNSKSATFASADATRAYTSTMAPTEEFTIATSVPPQPPPHFVIVPLVAQGHTIPMVDLARLLAERGTRVSLVTTPVNGARLRGVAVQAARAKLPLEIVELSFPPAVFGLPPGCENVDQIKDNDHFLPLFHALRELAGPLEAYVRAQAPRPSCIISDWCNSWTADVARSVGVPRLFFHGPSCFYSLCDLNTAAHGLHEQAAATADGYETYVVPGMPVRVEVTRAMGPGFFNSPGWETLREDAMEAMRTADGAVVNTFMDLEDEFVACYEAALGKPVWTLGPFCLCNQDAEAMSSRGNKSSVDQSAVTAWLDTMEPDSVVYVSFGSLARKLPKQLFEVGHGLEDSGKPFLWVVKESEVAAPEVQKWLEALEARTAGRGLVLRGWAPQLAILSHRAVGGFVTHCGWNSLLESIAHGVPVVTWPHFADQFLNERLAVDVLGVGVPIGLTMPVMMFDDEAVPVLRGDIVRAVSALMGGGEVAGEMRRKAKEYGEKAHRAMEKGGSSYENLTQLIESFMQSGGRET